ncbi:hypothetical protein AB0J48_06230 [Nocardia salmonicida]
MFQPWAETQSLVAQDSADVVRVGFAVIAEHPIDAPATAMPVRW